MNIPTAELRDFAETYEASRRGKLLYPRDPSLDPQLVWKGKDEQDREPLEVPVVPVYIQSDAAAGDHRERAGPGEEGGDGGW